MASSPSSPVTVTIYDDFDEAQVMSTTSCKQVSMKEYEQDITDETDKALGVSFNF